MTKLTDYLDKLDARAVELAKSENVEIRIERDDRGQFPCITVRPMRDFSVEEKLVQRKETKSGRKGK